MIEAEILLQLAKYISNILGDHGFYRKWILDGSNKVLLTIEITPYAWIKLSGTLIEIESTSRRYINYKYSIYKPSSIDDACYQALEIQYKYHNYLKQKKRHKHGH